ncbi:hypothetical protein J4G33_08885 [Actinotalea sp. BY-33]|uniref:Uncharacterized protein n=1 Tax=Actinotalea soli TaxID=2819234 RepID=A0A939RW81_9CELL|nr:hypothetical protein [Actinotalea soli]MBO1751916.1 hypothetical protein [Actinotalea soli]
MSSAPSASEEPDATAAVTALEPLAAPMRAETASPDAAGGDLDPLAGYVEVGEGSWIPAGGPGDCTGSAYLSIGTAGGKGVAELLLPENLADTGSRRFADGEVGYDGEGRIATYTAAAGDVEGVIGERLCVDNGGLLGMLNGHAPDEPIQPGEVLVIDPAAVPGFEYEGTSD